MPGNTALSSLPRILLCRESTARARRSYAWSRWRTSAGNILGALRRVQAGDMRHIHPLLRATSLQPRNTLEMMIRDSALRARHEAWALLARKAFQLVVIDIPVSSRSRTAQNDRACRKRWPCAVGQRPPCYVMGMHCVAGVELRVYRKVACAPGR